MRTAVITINGSRYGRGLLRALATQSHRADLVVVVEDTWKRKWHLLQRVARRIGWRDAILYAMEEITDRTVLSLRESRQRKSYQALAAEVVYVDAVRSTRLPGLLNTHRIDLVLLGQSGIIPPEVLKVPRIGTLNAHPGILPAYRGIDCPEWAIFQEEFHMVGSAVHWVDSGVDTGPILAKLCYAWRGDESLRTLTDRLYVNCIQLLVGTTNRLRDSNCPSEPNIGGKQYYKMSRVLRRQTARKLERFLAQKAFR